jgi:hypothetical protein
MSESGAEEQARAKELSDEFVRCWSGPVVIERREEAQRAIAAALRQSAASAREEALREAEEIARTQPGSRYIIADAIVALRGSQQPAQGKEVEGQRSETSWYGSQSPQIARRTPSVAGEQVDAPAPQPSHPDPAEEIKMSDIETFVGEVASEAAERAHFSAWNRAIEAAATLHDCAAQEMNRLRDPGMANHHRQWAAKIRKLAERAQGER